MSVLIKSSHEFEYLNLFGVIMLFLIEIDHYELLNKFLVLVSQLLFGFPLPLLVFIEWNLKVDKNLFLKLERLPCV